MRVHVRPIGIAPRVAGGSDPHALMPPDIIYILVADEAMAAAHLQKIHRFVLGIAITLGRNGRRPFAPQCY